MVLHLSVRLPNDGVVFAGEDFECSLHFENKAVVETPINSSLDDEQPLNENSIGSVNKPMSPESDRPVSHLQTKLSVSTLQTFTSFISNAVSAYTSSPFSPKIDFEGSTNSKPHIPAKINIRNERSSIQSPSCLREFPVEMLDLNPNTGAGSSRPQNIGKSNLAITTNASDINFGAGTERFIDTDSANRTALSAGGNLDLHTDKLEVNNTVGSSAPRVRIDNNDREDSDFDHPSARSTPVGISSPKRKKVLNILM